MSAPAGPPATARLVFVTGLSGAGKSTVLHALEDLGFEVVDNAPIGIAEALARDAQGPLALGVHARNASFHAWEVLDTIRRLRDAGRRPELVYVWADEDSLQRRYTETRRRHPLAPHGRVTDGIRSDDALTAELREGADLVIDTSALTLPGLRALVEQDFGAGSAVAGRSGLNVSLVSFAFPIGLPREADLVFDARFLRNPHYDPTLRSRTGQDAEVRAYIEADPDFPAFLGSITGLLSLVLPRFVQEGKKYSTIAVGCTGGRHRSVCIVERLAAFLRTTNWHTTVTHRELSRQAQALTGAADTPGSRHESVATGADAGRMHFPVHRAQEA